MRDIAEEAGVDKSTVSLALRNDRRLAEKTRRRIQAIAKKLGYRRDPALSALQAHRWSMETATVTQSIALIADQPQQNRLGYQAAVESAQQSGYRLEEFQVSQYAPDELTRTLLARGIKGIIVSSLREPTKPEFIDWQHFSAVAIGDGFVTLPLHTIASNVFKSIQICWQKLHEAGYKRVGQAPLSHTEYAEDDDLRHGAAYVNQKTGTAAEQQIPVLTSNVRDKASFLNWFEKYRPDAVLGFHCVVPDWLTAEGYKIPEDVGVACQLRPTHNPRIAGTDSDFAARSQACVRLVDQLIRNNEIGIPQNRQLVFVEPHWVPAESVQQH